MVGRSALPSILAAIASAALLAGVSGCGSGDSPGDNEQVESVVRRVLTHNDPALCEATTPRYLEQNYGEHVDDPLEQCRFESVLPGQPTARRVDFESVRVSGEQAIVRVALKGGGADGSEVTIALAEEDGRWKLDHLDAIQIDRPRFDAANRRDLLITGVSSREADCAVRRLHRFYDTDQLEGAIVAGKTDGFNAAGAIYLSRKSLVEQLRRGFRKGAPKDVPDPIVECVGRRISKGVSTGLLRAFFAAPDKLDDLFDRAVQEAAKACGKEAESGLLPEPSVS